MSRASAKGTWGDPGKPKFYRPSGAGNTWTDDLNYRKNCEREAAFQQRVSASRLRVYTPTVNDEGHAVEAILSPTKAAYKVQPAAVTDDAARANVTVTRASRPVTASTLKQARYAKFEAPPLEGTYGYGIDGYAPQWAPPNASNSLSPGRGARPSSSPGLRGSRGRGGTAGGRSDARASLRSRGSAAASVTAAAIQAAVEERRRHGGGTGMPGSEGALTGRPAGGALPTVRRSLSRGSLRVTSAGSARPGSRASLRSARSAVSVLSQGGLSESGPEDQYPRTPLKFYNDAASMASSTVSESLLADAAKTRLELQSLKSTVQREAEARAKAERQLDEIARTLKEMSSAQASGGGVAMGHSGGGAARRPRLDAVTGSGYGVGATTKRPANYWSGKPIWPPPVPRSKKISEEKGDVVLMHGGRRKYPHVGVPPRNKTPLLAQPRRRVLTSDGARDRTRLKNRAWPRTVV